MNERMPCLPTGRGGERGSTMEGRCSLFFPDFTNSQARRLRGSEESNPNFLGVHEMAGCPGWMMRCFVRGRWKRARGGCYGENPKTLSPRTRRGTTLVWRKGMAWRRLNGWQCTSMAVQGTTCLVERCGFFPLRGRRAKGDEGQGG